MDFLTHTQRTDIRTSVLTPSSRNSQRHPRRSQTTTPSRGTRQPELITPVANTFMHLPVRAHRRGDDAPITRDRVKALEAEYITAVRNAGAGGGRDLVHVAQEVQVLTDLCLGDVAEQLLTSCTEQSDLLLHVRDGYSRVFANYRSAFLLCQQRVAELSETFYNEREAHAKSRADAIGVIQALIGQRADQTRVFREQRDELEQRRVKEVQEAYNDVRAVETKYHTMHELFLGLQADDSVERLRESRREVAALRTELDEQGTTIDQLEGVVRELKATVAEKDRVIEQHHRERERLRGAVRAEKERRNLCQQCARNIDVQGAELAQTLLARQKRYESALEELDEDLHLTAPAIEEEMGKWIAPPEDGADAVTVDLGLLAHRVAVVAVRLKALPGISALYQENALLKAKVEELADAESALAAQKSKFSLIMSSNDELEARIEELERALDDARQTGGSSTLTPAQVRAVAAQQLPPVPAGLDLLAPAAGGQPPSLGWTLQQVYLVMQARAAAGMVDGHDLLGPTVLLDPPLDSMAVYIHSWAVTELGTRAKADGFVERLMLGLATHKDTVEVSCFTRMLPRVDHVLFIIAGHLLAHGTFIAPEPFLIDIDTAEAVLLQLAGVADDMAVRIVEAVWELATGADMVDGDNRIPTCFLLDRVCRMYEAEVDAKLAALAVIAARPAPARHPFHSFSTALSAVFPEVPAADIAAIYRHAVSLAGPTPPVPVITRAIKEGGFLARAARPVGLPLGPAMRGHGIGMSPRVITGLFDMIQAQLDRPGMAALEMVDPTWPHTRDRLRGAALAALRDKGRLAHAAGLMLALQAATVATCSLAWGLGGATPVADDIQPVQFIYTRLVAGNELLKVLCSAVALEEAVEILPKKKAKKGKGKKGKGKKK